MKSFKDLGLSERVLKVLSKKGFEEPTPIQEKVIPAILDGDKDIIGQARTGTGKTAAFGLPIIELIGKKSKNVQALVLTPTRELAIQVAEEIHSLKGKRKLSIIPIYGGQSIKMQFRSLKKGVDIVVGTPGRIMDHLRRGTLKLDAISFFVLDEADEMLNMGFLDDVKKIMKSVNPNKRTMLFSATMPPEIMDVAQRYMGKYKILKATDGQLTVSQTDQIYFEVNATDKFEALCRIIDIEEVFYGLVFCRTKLDVDEVANHLMERGYDADALHGDMSQHIREKILNKFKKQISNILVATDVAARGLDVQDLTHVINYALPQSPESYVHRIGRTGRAGKEGVAITFITPSEYRKLKVISKVAKTDIRKAQLPKVRDVIESKKLRIKADLDEIIQSYPSEEYMDMAFDLMEDDNPEIVLAAMLQYSFADELDVKSYPEIQDAIVDKKGKTRLFVTQGKKDGLNKKKLERFIITHCKTPRKKIRDIEVLDKYSFVTLPFHDAEILLTKFKDRGKKKGKKRRKKGAPPTFTKAKKK